MHKRAFHASRLNSIAAFTNRESYTYKLVLGPGGDGQPARSTNHVKHEPPSLLSTIHQLCYIMCGGR